MDRGKIEARITELTAERVTVAARLDAARAAARDAMVAGELPPQEDQRAALLAETEDIDAALAELRDRLTAAHDADVRKARIRTIERAAELTADRRAKAEAVDAALATLHLAWLDYAASVQSSVGMVASAGGDVVPLRRLNFNGRQSDALVKALVAASGMDLVRALGVETSNRREHGTALAVAEDRVALSLQAELARVRSTSPQQHVAREAERELEEIEGRMANPLEL
ncbi:MAG: hypothetical protein V4753_04415 [Pseudomonadota bacterium]